MGQKVLFGSGVEKAAWGGPERVFDANSLRNEKILSHDACKTCGIFTYSGHGENAKDGNRVNLGCVEGLVPLALEIKIIDGKSVPLVG
jgi:hypothetical protein